jgi:hypothetical protein
MRVQAIDSAQAAQRYFMPTLAMKAARYFRTKIAQGRTGNSSSKISGTTPKAAPVFSVICKLDHSNMQAGGKAWVGV